MKKMLFLVNPNAGHSGIRAALLDVVQLFSAEYDVNVFVTTAPKQIIAKIAEDGNNFDLVVVSGGDGSLSEAVAGLLKIPADRRPPIGYIPAGTTNDVAATLSIPSDPVKAAEVVLHGREFVLDSGRMNDEYFTYVAAFGAFTALTYETPQAEKKSLGYLAYLLQGIRSIGTIKPIHAVITADGSSYEGDFLVGGIGNTLSVGGMHNTNVNKLGISLNDGMHEAVFIKDQKDILQYPNLLSSASQLDLSNPDYFVYLKTNQLDIEFSEETAWTIDGENGGSHRACHIQNIPQAVRILIPNE